ncbi:MAG: hypothetical protein GTN78_12020, partial [Gemmatimonadales bacterium]|nr:hypothetical protein [Gemmatimonadales bacterium]
MLWLLQLLVWCLALALAARASDDDPGSAPEWTIYVTNDDCPDYTWGFVEEQTRQNLADIVAGHLDEINRTDGDAWENQDRYNMCIALEALCLVERYPERKDELIR